MSWLSPGRWLLYGALAAALLLGIWRLDASRQQIGYDKAQAQYTAQALIASEAARKKEAELQSKVTKVSHAYQAEKVRRAALERSVNVGLRDFHAALNQPSPDPATPGGANGTGGLERELLGTCAKNLAELAIAADRLEAKVLGLQQYVNKVVQGKP